MNNTEMCAVLVGYFLVTMILIQGLYPAHVTIDFPVSFVVGHSLISMCLSVFIFPYKT